MTNANARYTVNPKPTTQDEADLAASLKGFYKAQRHGWNRPYVAERVTFTFEGSGRSAAYRKAAQMAMHFGEGVIDAHLEGLRADGAARRAAYYNKRNGAGSYVIGTRLSRAAAYRKAAMGK